MCRQTWEGRVAALTTAIVKFTVIFNEVQLHTYTDFMRILMILWIIRIAINFHTEVMRVSIIYTSEHVD